MNGERTHVHGWRPQLAGVLAGAASLLMALASAPAAHADLSPFVTDGPVYAITSTGGNTFIGGSFAHVGPRTGGGVALGAAGTSKPGQAQLPVAAEVAGGEVDAVISDGAGGWYLGGTFTTVADQPRSGLAHVKPEGTLDPGFAPNPNGAVRALALGLAGRPDAGVLYVGGSFTQMAGQHRGYLAALKPDGSLVAGWDPEPDLDVRALVVVPVNVDVTTTGTTTDTSSVSMSVVFTGGDFTKIGTGPTQSTQPTNAHGLAAVWGAGATASCTASGATPPACTANQVGGQSITDPNSPANAWAPGSAGASVQALAVGQPYLINSTSSDPCPAPAASSNETCTLSAPVYVGTVANATAVSAFPFNLTVSGSPNNRSKVGTASNPFGPISGWSPATDAAATVRALSLWPQPNYAAPITAAPTSSTTPPVLYVGGSFTTLSGDPHPNIGALQGVTDPNTGSNVPNAAPSYKSWSPSTDAPVSSLVLGGGPVVYAGGDFASLCATAPPCGSSTRAFAGVLGGVTTQSGTGNAATLDPWDAKLAGGPVRALALAGNSVFAGGSFTAVAAQPRANLAAFDGTGQLLDWKPAATITATTSCTADSATSTVTCTSSSPANPATTSCTASGTTTTSPPPCTPAAISSSVRALVASGNTVYAGGSFDHIGSNAIVNLAALDSLTGNPVAGFTAPNPDNQVLALSLTNQSLYLGGAFGQLAGPTGRSHVAAVDPASGAIQGWNPGADDIVYSLAASCSTVYAGGSFQNIGGQPRDRIAALDPVNGQASGWDPQSDSTVLTLARSGATVYAGGSFSLIGSAPRAHIAALDADTAKASDWNPYSDYTVRAIALDGSTIYAGGTFTNIGGADRANLAALDAGTGEATSFNPGAAASVRALYVSGNQLKIGGEFSNLGTRTQQGFGAMIAANDASSQATTCTAPVVPVNPSGSGSSSSSGQTKTPPSTNQTGNGTGAGQGSGLMLSAFDIAPRRFRVATVARRARGRARHSARARRSAPAPRPVVGGATFHFALNAPGVATITISAPRRGRPTGLCPRAAAVPGAVKRCPVFDQLGSIVQRGRLGGNATFFTGRVHGRALKPGTYLATITATDGARVASPRTTSFRILAPRSSPARKPRRAPSH